MTATVTCSKCGLPIRWLLVAGRSQCLNPDGTVHWDKCSQERTARVKRDGKPFKDDEGEGYIYDGKKHYFHRVAATAFGKPVKPTF